MEEEKEEKLLKKTQRKAVSLRASLTVAGNTNVFHMAPIWKMNESEKPEGDSEGQQTGCTCVNARFCKHASNT